MIFWGRGFGRPKKQKALERAEKEEEDVGSLKLLSDSPQCEVHLAMLPHVQLVT